MDGNTVAHRLIAGSTAIDRMKKEVEQVIRMVMGLLNAGDLFRKGVSSTGEFYVEFRDYACERCEWRVSVNRYPSVYCVECWIPFQRGALSLKLAYSSTPNAIPFRTENAQRVHEALSVFVQGMIEHFPELSERLQPFLDAADVIK